LFHTDAVQAFCKIECNAKSLGADLISLSAHKLHGPKGVGALWIRPDIKLPPLIQGGGQEHGLRSGTEALHNIAGFAKAVELSIRNFDKSYVHFQTLQTSLRQALPERIPDVRFLPQGAPHIVSLSLPGSKSEIVMNYLDSIGIAISHASACKRGGQSHVLTAMGLPKDVIDGTIRVSFSPYTTLGEIHQLIQGLARAKELFFGGTP
ncbi:MAG: aminotransferase class V-fold PLP-dependent enzyme, partial [Oscillospiraceae bacterium]|nr:aminotransferase class V-fold PLP-dependent enzyme [Oscillospiraceae bacterium]